MPPFRKTKETTPPTDVVTSVLEIPGARLQFACAAVVGDGGGGEATRPSGLSMGLSLVFLLAKTSNEFNKMATVRAEMEALIRDLKGQHTMATANTGGDDDVPGDRNPDSATSSCLTDGNEP
ncbi:protein POLAR LOCALIZATION DURING ASYMMETRIC DIVISION AND REDISTRIBUTION-like [Hordeum vulgare]|nr:protein POLAR LOCALIZATION DURING ASYMMETRIC DIVISION AND REDISTRIBUTION-like [Hordeum vulgare]